MKTIKFSGKVIVCILCAFIANSPAVVAQNQKDLVGSYNFDNDPTDGSMWGPIVYDATTYHNSGRSIKYVRTDVNSYDVVSKKLSITPLTQGAIYTASIWIKTTNMSSDAKALICIESSNENGWINGSYLNVGVTGESGWSKLEVTYQIPANATNANVSLYISRGGTGTVWFDDLCIYKQTPIIGENLTPIENYNFDQDITDGSLSGPVVYDGTVFHNSERSLKYQRTDATSYDLISKDFKVNPGETFTPTCWVKTTGMSANAQALICIESFNGSSWISGSYLEVGVTGESGWTMLQVPAYQIPANATNARVALYISQGGTGTAWFDDLCIYKKMPTPYKDSDGRFIVNGSPFFPLGMYFGSVSNADIDVYANSSFNTILPYDGSLTDATMNYANSKGLKVLFSVKDYFYNVPGSSCPAYITSIESEIAEIVTKVNLYKNYPALLGWYMNDEISAGAYGDRILNHYNTIKANDVTRPVYVVDCHPTQESLYQNMTDAFGSDSYPVKGFADDNIGEVGIWNRTAKQGLPNKLIWTVVQIHNLDNYFKNTNGSQRTPNQIELRNMTWQSICEGSTGIIYYSWFDAKTDVSGTPFNTHWGNLKTVAAELKNLTPVILSVDPVPSVTVTGADTWLNYIVKSYQNKTYIFSVNNTKIDGKSASFKIPGATSCKDLLTGEVTALTNGKITVTNYGALGVKLFEISSDTDDSQKLSAATSLTNTNNNLFKVFPNPNTGDFIVTFNNLEKDNYTLEVTNLLGQNVYKENLNNFSGSINKQLSLSNNKKGVYIITLTKNNGSKISKKLVVN